MSVNQEAVLKTISKLSKSQYHWKNLPTQDKQKILKITYQRLLEKKEQASLLITKEMGKPIKESKAEVEKCLKTILLCCTENLPQLQPREVSSNTYSKSVITHEPLGVIYSIMPWNFPLWQAVRMIYPSLLAGNTVLLKHSEITKGMGSFIEDLFQDIWKEPLLKHHLLPHEFSEFVISQPEIGGVSLTGSTQAGLTISSLAGKYLKKCVLELGGSDPYLIFADANLDQAAKIVTKARMMNTGQSCICAKRCLVEESALEKFLENLKVEFSKYNFGDPNSEKTDLGPLAHERLVEGFNKQIKEFEKVMEPKLVFTKPHEQDANRYVNSSIYLIQKNSEWLNNQEFFAPVLIVQSFKSEEEAIHLANQSAYALGASVWTQDLEKAYRIAQKVSAGQLSINDYVKSDASLPFGGFKQSGLGRELGMEGFLEFTQTKVISI